MCRRKNSFAASPVSSTLQRQEPEGSAEKPDSTVFDLNLEKGAVVRLGTALPWFLGES